MARSDISADEGSHADVCRRPPSVHTGSVTTPSPTHELAVLRLRGNSEDDAVAWIGRHGLLGLADDERLESGVRERLEAARVQQFALNSHRIWQLGAIVDALGDVPCCPLKGMDLLERLYAGRVEERPMQDLDVLVPEARLDEAVARLGAALGLRETAHSRAQGDTGFHRVLDNGEIFLELHGRLGHKHSPRSSWEELALERRRVHGREVWALRDATCLAYLLAHLAKHRPYACLKWVHDIWLLAPRVGAHEARVAAAGLGALQSAGAAVRAIATLVEALPEARRPTLPASLRPASWPRSLAARCNDRLVWRIPRAGDMHLADEGAAGSRVERGLSALLLSDSLGDAARYGLLALRSLAPVRADG